MSPDIPPERASAIRNATPADVESLSGALVRAFRDDPAHRRIFPKESAWARNSHRLFAALLRPRIGHATVFTTSGREGGALWDAPDHARPGPLEFMRVAAQALPLLGFRAWLVLKGLNLLQAHRPEEPHWYLFVFGTDRVHQGRGIGSALLAPILARCDAERLPSYLEASKEANVPFYERHGFEVCGVLNLHKGPSVWPMRREPRG
jgi:GNAT superfamily N-acetyltransferase